MNTGYSIITDFGCKTNCPYCVWKDHKLYNAHHDYQHFLKNVDNFLNNVVDDYKVSVSGGGDPLNNFNNHFSFWKLLVESNKKIDIHTSYINFDDFNHKLLQNSLNRIVFHATTDNIQNNIWDIYRFSLLYKVRVNFVVTYNLNIHTVQKFELLADKLNIQISYRELVSNDPQLQPYQYITDFCCTSDKRYPFIKYVKQADYNTYLMPDGTIQQTFLMHK